MVEKKDIYTLEEPEDCQTCYGITNEEVDPKPLGDQLISILVRERATQEGQGPVSEVFVTERDVAVDRGSRGLGWHGPNTAGPRVGRVLVRLLSPRVGKCLG
eukprot:gene13464-biopygen14096